jgi:hypothetical protein
MACWYLALGIDNIPTNMPTKRPDVSKRLVNVGERMKPKGLLENKEKYRFGE